MFQIQSPVQGAVTPSQVEALLVELDDEQLGTVTGGTPTGGWGSANASALPVGGW